MVDALDGFAEARAILACPGHRRHGKSRSSTRGIQSPCLISETPPCLGWSLLNSHYERYAEDPAQYKAQFWIAVLAHLQRATKDDDVAGDAILKVIVGLKNYRHIGKFSAWLNTVARTCIADAKTKSKEDCMSPDKLERLVSSLPAPDQIRLDLSCVADVIDRMLCEAMVEGLSLAESVVCCNLKIGAARTRLRRLGKKLGSACPLLR
jgi:DNA-directed RNA polymerase specialized sigma24 family protein